MDFEIAKTPESLSAPAREMLKLLTAIRHRLETAGSYTLVAYLDEPIAKLTVAHHDAVWTLCQADYRTALLALMELLQARQISIDEIGDRMWRFHCTPEAAGPLSVG